MAKFPTYEKMAKDVAEKALDEYIYKGKTLREWIDILSSSEKPNKWIPANQPPKVSGKYIVTRHFSNNDFVEMASYATDLHKVDKYDFPKRKAGWYNYDSEYGHYEVDDIVAWMPSPESYKQEVEE